MYPLNTCDLRFDIISISQYRYSVQLRTMCVCAQFVSCSLFFLYHETLDARLCLKWQHLMRMWSAASVDLSALCQHTSPPHSTLLLPAFLPASLYLFMQHTCGHWIQFTIDLYICDFLGFPKDFQLTF